MANCVQKRKPITELGLDAKTENLLRKLRCTTLGDFLELDPRYILQIPEGNWDAFFLVRKNQEELRRQFNIESDGFRTSEIITKRASTADSIPTPRPRHGEDDARLTPNFADREQKHQDDEPKKSMKVTSAAASDRNVVGDCSGRQAQNTTQDSEGKSAVPLLRAFSKRVRRSLRQLGLKTREQFSSLKLEGRALAGLQERHRHEVWMEIQAYLERDTEEGRPRHTATSMGIDYGFPTGGRTSSPGIHRNERYQKTQIDLDRPLMRDDFSVRAWHCIERLGVRTWDELSALTSDEVSAVPGAGLRTWCEISTLQQVAGSLTKQGRSSQVIVPPAANRRESGSSALETINGDTCRHGHSSGLVIQCELPLSPEGPTQEIFSVRAWHCLEKLKIKNWDDFLSLTHDRVLRTPSAGEKTWKEISAVQQRLRARSEAGSVHATPKAVAIPPPSAPNERQATRQVQDSSRHHINFLDTYAALAVPPKPILDTAVVVQLTVVLSSHFTNGCRLNSPIEMARFRSFAAADLGKELTLADEELKSYIAACGITFDGKVYAVSASAKERIKGLAEDYFANGAQAMFYAEFYAKNQNWMFEASVVSKDMLIEILRKLFPKLSFTQTYFGYTDASVFAALESEILRVWGDDVLLTYEQLADRLRYIPLERIKYALGQNGDFIWSTVETFSHVSRIDITDEEREAIRKAAVRECNARGYASITDLPFGEIAVRNYELSITAVHDAVYRICLSDKFDKKGKIITRKGEVLDALTIMKDYCRTIDKCSIDDLLNFERELTGEVHRWIPMEAGNTVLIRIDKDTYVAERYVRFNAAATDKAIELFVREDYLPVKSFTTFGAFPDCGQTWNLFLLESYCRRFSRKFRFDAPSVNSRNAGAVIRKSCGMDYTEIMTDAVANADVPLKDTAVGKFLYESGYTGRSTTAKVNEIIDKAKAIRESRD